MDPRQSNSLLHHIRETTLSAGPIRRRPKFGATARIAAAIVAAVAIYFAAQAAP